MNYLTSHKAVHLPKISIVMPVLNREETIEKAIRSVLDQAYANVELIIIDGGSHDKTVDIIKRYEKYLAYWHSQFDGSAIVAANSGIEKASGDLVALLMADDWYETGTLQKVGEALIANPDADMITCGGKIVYFDDVSKRYKTWKAFTSARSLNLSFYNICFANSAICCRFVRKSLYDRIGLYQPFDAAGKHLFSNDKDFLLRAVMHQAKDVFVHHIGHHYLAHKTSATFGNNHSNIRRLCQEHMDMAERYLKAYDLSNPHRFLLAYWYNDQSARLLLYKLLDRDFRSAFLIAKAAVWKYHLIWPGAFLLTTGKIIIKKGLRLVYRACLTPKK